ncbi:MAG TPA: hypothetical protein VF988_10710, partial [Verrucomicrobiae bacterium]
MSYYLFSPGRAAWRQLVLVLVLGIVLAGGSVARGATFAEWAAGYGLTGNDALPTANPDGDPYVNALEYAFGTDPLHADSIADVGPSLTVMTNAGTFVYRMSAQSQGVATFRVVQATNLASPNWTDVGGAPVVVPVSTNYSLCYQAVDMTAPNRFFRLEVTVPYAPGFEVKVLVGTDVGNGYWDGLPVVSQAYIRQQAPDISVIVTNQVPSTTNQTPNLTKYPEVVGTSLTAATPDLQASLAQSGERLRRRSWMGWFLWGNGTPPPGLSAGYPVTGTYQTNSSWDFFSYQFPAKSTNTAADGAWQPIRLDQQPLYLNPFRINYAWPPGQFGYKVQPLKPFAQQAGYWANKRIVRGPNLSFANPFFVQYADKITAGDTPDAWRSSWFYMRTRPLETLLVLPGNLKPVDLIKDGAWNNTGTNHEPYPYPVWNTNLAPQDQTPFAIQVDRMGDWDADLVWEGTQPLAQGYSTNRYHRTAFNQPGQGNYLKMTVAQGSPFIWCETHNNRYVNFYNLIRQNLTNSIANNAGTAAETVSGGPWSVPGVTGVKYVLFYGDHNNPNQWYHEAAPWFYDAVNAQPGGFNPPGQQHNHTYIALFYRDSAVQPITLGSGGIGAKENNGTDLQGNPYFYMEFKNSGKNWFVVGAVPVMSYYHSGVTVDDEATRVAGARAWAEQMGKYAFNFVTGTKITYSAENMDLVTTTYTNTLQNPYVAAGDPTAAGMTANASQTVMALLPHHYQPLTLGPDLTHASKPEVVWNPLKQYDGNFTVASAPPNANKNNPTSTSRWGYWGPRGTMKTIISGSFKTQYPFQNFLPVMPPPNLNTNYRESGIQVVRITGTGTGYHAITNPVPNALIHTSTATNGSGAAFKVLLEPYTGRVMQVDVLAGGAGYPDGNPPNTNLVWLTIDPPQISPANGGRQATARLQIGGGKVLAVFMNDKGAGYDSTISITQTNVSADPPIIVPPFDASGNLALGAATIISGGAGFDFSNTNNPPVVKVIGTGTGATAEILKPGSVIGVGPSAIGTSAGVYPSSGNLADDAARIQASLPPPSGGGAAQNVVVTSVQRVPNTVIAAVTDKGQYGSQPTASFVDDNSATIPLGVNFAGGEVLNVYWPGGPTPNVVTPKDVVFAGGDTVTRPAQAKVYGAVTVSGVGLTGPSVGGYAGDTIVSFNGGNIFPSGVTLPQIAYTINTNGAIGSSLSIVQPGTGWNYGGTIRIAGGKGFDAAAKPIIGPSGEILAVKVLRQGNNYPNTVYTRIEDIVTPSSTAQLSVQVQDGHIVGVNVISGGLGYTNPVITFTAVAGGDEINQPAKGESAEITFGANGSGGIANLMLTKAGARYLPGTETNATPDSPATYLRWDAVNPMPFARPIAQAANYVATVVSPKISVEQVIYDNLITQYKSLASADLKPFGGGFGGTSGPDGYGLGNQLSAAAKYIGVLYNFEQYYAAAGKDQPDIPPSSFAFNDGMAAASAY